MKNTIILPLSNRLPHNRLLLLLYFESSTSETLSHLLKSIYQTRRLCFTPIFCEKILYGLYIFDLLTDCLQYSCVTDDFFRDSTLNTCLSDTYFQSLTIILIILYSIDNIKDAANSNTIFIFDTCLTDFEWFDVECAKRSDSCFGGRQRMRKEYNHAVTAEVL